jgi:hypothetical protein
MFYQFGSDIDFFSFTTFPQVLEQGQVSTSAADFTMDVL